MKKQILILIAILFITGCSNKYEEDTIETSNLDNVEEAMPKTSLYTIRSLQTKLNVLLNVNVSGNDYMSTRSVAEASNFPIKGQTYYMPSTSIYGTKPFYRMYNGTKHMTSTSAREGNYSKEFALGYAWKPGFAPVGTTSMYRSPNYSNGDHSLMSVKYGISGYYTKEYFGTYAYPRYNTPLKLLTLSGNKITVKSNLVAGGSVWELWYRGQQFLDHVDYGREMQSSLNLGHGALPTEAGDKHQSGNANFMHGSPILEARNSGKTQITTAIPLEWHNTTFNGNRRDELVIYKDFKLGKRLTLDNNLNLGSYNYLNAQIIKYETTFYTPTTLTGAHIEIPTAYLKPVLKRFFEINATKSNLNQGLTEVSLSSGQSQQAPIHHAGGIVIADQSLNYAMGVYINVNKAKASDSDPNAIYYFRNWRFGDTSKWSAGRKGTIRAGNNKYTSYVIVGTLNEVRVAMRQLYVKGY